MSLGPSLRIRVLPYVSGEDRIGTYTLLQQTWRDATGFEVSPRLGLDRPKPLQQRLIPIDGLQSHCCCPFAYSAPGPRGSLATLIDGPLLLSSPAPPDPGRVPRVQPGRYPHIFSGFSSGSRGVSRLIERRSERRVGGRMHSRRIFPTEENGNHIPRVHQRRLSGHAPFHLSQL